jgi:translation initiation factor IF-1
MAELPYSSPLEHHAATQSVRRAVIAGLAKPVVTIDGDRVTVTTSGLQLECARATVREKGQEVVVTLAPLRS